MKVPRGVAGNTGEQMFRVFMNRIFPYSVGITDDGGPSDANFTISDNGTEGQISIRGDSVKIKSESPYTEITGAHRRYETQCVEDLCDLVPKGTPVVEFFGGLGLLAEVFNRKIQPAQFSTCEMYEDLYLKLAEKFGDQAHYGDTFSHSFDKITPGSLVSLDFNTFTTLTLVTGVKKDRDYLKDFKDIEHRGARYIHLTDCAGLKLHFHLGNYSKRFSYKVEDRYDYCQAVQPTYRNLLGWSMLGFRYHPGAFHFLFSTSSYLQTEPCATFDNKNVRGFPTGAKK